VTATIPVGRIFPRSPRSIAVDTATHGDDPTYIDVDPRTHHVYVANENADQIEVIAPC